MIKNYCIVTLKMKDYYQKKPREKQKPYGHKQKQTFMKATCNSGLMDHFLLI